MVGSAAADIYTVLAAASHTTWAPRASLTKRSGTIALPPLRSGG